MCTLKLTLKFRIQQLFLVFRRWAKLARYNFYTFKTKNIYNRLKMVDEYFPEPYLLGVGHKTARGQTLPSLARPRPNLRRGNFRSFAQSALKFTAYTYRYNCAILSTFIILFYFLRMDDEDLCFKLWRIRKTVMAMCHDRKYLIAVSFSCP